MDEQERAVARIPPAKCGPGDAACLDRDAFPGVGVGKCGRDDVGQGGGGHVATLARVPTPLASDATSGLGWSTPRMSILTDERLRLRLAITALVCLVGFVAIAVLVRAGATVGIDTAALDGLRRFHGRMLDPIFVAISELGVADVLQFFTMIPAGFLWVAGARRAAVYLVTVYLAATVATEVLKAALPVARPAAVYQVPLRMSEAEDLLWIAFAAILVLAFWRTRWRWGAVIGAALFGLGLFFDPMPLATPGVDSFPSGHSLRSIALVASLLFALPKRPSRGLVAAATVVVILIGVSRVYLGEHHPTDVVAGWLAGLTLVTLLTLIPFFRYREEILLLDGTVLEVPGKRRVAQ